MTTAQTTSSRLPPPDLPDDPNWHKDAIIYELHIRAFSDSNADGIGDLGGLIEKLDYLADLGVTAVWLLPFYPSPLRDGGYDIADYTNVHESYGTRRDVTRLLREAHRRGIRIITELVLNHTSVDHPWFARARRAPAGSTHRDFYVWSDSPTRYEDARIIFKDFETSNWTWDAVAKAYYWHRFYSHQPDLNFDNPAVQDAILEVVDFWMDIGVDGLRLDAVPYLYERDGTSCENLPETHAFLRRLRSHIDKKYKNRILLAEANQWPTDAAAYFGNGDECHMNFHFPLMPRMFMGIELEDSFPIVDILQRTPHQPDGCQWATFLRNHDELTLEMVTDEDRDTMWRAYASERTARINLGIRRRLAPLLRSRRKIELMTSLLLSLPGTPVLYYGDEIGMGDNIYLGDRDGVRTPMQWSSDRNAGFSRANPQRLYLPPVIDPEFHYEAINVEAQQQNPSSLLWWTKRLIAKRKEHKVFGRGSIDFPHTSNARVLVYTRELGADIILVVANLSRFVQCVEMELERFRGMVPREVFGKARFPMIGNEPYFLSMAPHSFLWLELERPTESAVVRTEPARLSTTKSWKTLLTPPYSHDLQRALLHYASERRWFRSKARGKKSARIIDALGRDAGTDHAVVLLTIDFEEGLPETYVLPLAFTEDSKSIAPAAVIATVTVEEGTNGTSVTKTGVIYDALTSERFASSLLQTMQSRRSVAGDRGQLAGVPFGPLRRLPPDADIAPRPGTAEQSNSNVVYGDTFLLKVFRAMEDGPNPEFEIGRFLKERGFRNGARIAGALEYRRAGQEPGTVAVLFEHVANQGDAWRMTLDELDRYFERVLSRETPTSTDGTAVAQAEADTAFARQAIASYLERARLLGVRTAELHLALAGDVKNPAFAPEPFDAMHQQSLYQAAHDGLARTWRVLRKKHLEGDVGKLVERLVALEAKVDAALARVATQKIAVDKIRIHGDYHLGQVLWTGADFVIIDFEGEPGRPLAHRRFKRSPLRDVAAMMRSVHYAAAAALRSGRLRNEDLPVLGRWRDLWMQEVSAEFLGGYFERADGAGFLPRSAEERQTLLEFYLVDKCVYEIGYELNNRPDWLEIPASGLLALVERSS